MITITKWLQYATDKLHQADIPSPRLDAELILTHALGVDRSWLIAHGDEELDEAPASGVDGRGGTQNSSQNVKNFGADSSTGPEESAAHQPKRSFGEANAITIADLLLQKRLQRIPIAYLVGHKEFYGREFIVTPDVLIPRPETEAVIELALPLQFNKVIDVGCGSGCIGLTLKAERPEIELTLADVSPETLNIALQNAGDLNLQGVGFVESDLLSHWSSQAQPEQVDLIVANLPYVSLSWETSPETAHEPSLALYADNDGLELIFQLIDDTPKVLASRGHLLLEADPQQHAAIIDHARQAKLSHLKTSGYAVLFQA